MTLAAWDAIIIQLAHYATYRLRIGSVPDVFNIQVLAISLWVSVSYLAGRYSRGNSLFEGRGGISRWRTIFVAATFICIGGMQGWLFGIDIHETRLRGFLIPFTALVAIGCSAGEFLWDRIWKRSATYLVLCSEEEYSILIGEMSFMSKDFVDSVKFQICKDGIDWTTLAKQTNGANVVIGKHLTWPDGGISEVTKSRHLAINTVSLIDWCERFLQRVPPEFVDTTWFLKADGFSLRPGTIQWRIKRFVDLIGSGILILVLGPLAIAGAVAVKIEDGGPVIYSQYRTGLYGSIFKVWKLRTMRVDAEEDKAQWSSKNDPRVTVVGKFLRGSRLDEIPQLINVLAGEMSLVGPRPERPEIDNKLIQHLPHYEIRNTIRPGLSGWAQVSFPYGSSVNDSRMKLSYDIYYIRNSGLLLDLVILVKTIRLILWRHGSSPRS